MYGDKQTIEQDSIQQEDPNGNQTNATGNPWDERD